MLRITPARGPQLTGLGLFSASNYSGNCQTDTDEACRKKAQAQVDDAFAVVAMVPGAQGFAALATPIMKAWVNWATKQSWLSANKQSNTVYRPGMRDLEFLQSRWFWRGQENWDYAAHDRVTLEELAIKYLPDGTPPYNHRVADLYNLQSDEFKRDNPLTEGWSYRPLKDNEMVRMPYEAVNRAYTMGLSKPAIFANITGAKGTPFLTAALVSVSSLFNRAVPQRQATSLTVGAPTLDWKVFGAQASAAAAAAPATTKSGWYWGLGLLALLALAGVYAATRQENSAVEDVDVGDEFGD